MPDLREFCDRLWRGEIDVIHEAHPVTSTWNNREPEELDDGFLYIKSAASMNTLDTGDGLVMLDTGTARDAEGLYNGVRAWRPDTPLRAAVFSHHHVDHIFGVGRFDDEAERNGRARPVVYGQRHIPSHFDRYKRTVGYNTTINSRQFIRPGMDAEQVRLPWPDEFRYPDVTFDDAVRFSVGDLTFEVTHTRGETEDAAWTWVPERRWLFPGDLFIWAVPNAGNPQKVQRWAGEWAAGLRQMAGKGAEVMSPGHGFPIFGADRVAEALNDTADLLDDIENQTLAMMNLGYTLDRILHSVEMPQRLLDKPWLT
ncbi:MAG: MBL fold metallo-hydrolase, partial [Chloroflexi bacterium]|nr:MBL fold metallo-hydrolase [Chloroflexota bacterium]